MRQPGDLPVWLIAEAIHYRRSGANARPTYTASQITTSAQNKEEQGVAITTIYHRILLTCPNKKCVYSKNNYPNCPTHDLTQAAASGRRSNETAGRSSRLAHCGSHPPPPKWRQCPPHLHCQSNRYLCTKQGKEKGSQNHYPMPNLTYLSNRQNFKKNYPVEVPTSKR